MQTSVPLDRRTLLLSAFAMASVPAKAGQWCGSQYCSAGIEPSSWSQVYSTQKNSNWCWAASIQMLFASAGHDISQPEIVMAAYGQLVNLPAFSAQQIAALTNRPWTDASGDRFDSRLVAAYDYYAGVNAITNRDILASLQADNPLIYCNNHHAMLLVGADYAIIPNDIQVLGFHLFDPWPGMGLRRANPAEFFPMHAGGIMTYVGECQIS
jgi:Papain-like cysteine protease AvrRpt2